MIFFSFIFLTLFVHEGLSTSWSYTGANGPSNWPTLFPMYCAGTRQSPIDIDTMSTVLKFEKSFKFIDYNAEITTMTLTNTGHSPKVTIASSGLPRIKMGGLYGEYLFHSLHFHFGDLDTVGSEHTIDGNSYPMEMHMVHYLKRHGDFTTALGDSNGLAVLGFMFEISLTDNPAFAPIIDELANIANSGDTTTIMPAYPLSAFIPNLLSGFYRYEGSLTTPDCHEAVIWTVFKQTIPISESQMSIFRGLMDSDSNPMQNNYRPPQPLNGRPVYEVSHDQICVITG